MTSLLADEDLVMQPRVDDNENDFIDEDDGDFIDDEDFIEDEDDVVKAQKPWIEKYRPQKLTDVVSHKNVIQQVLAYLGKRDFPHMLFHGEQFISIILPNVVQH